ncbi:MAG: hypothetical protein QXU64_01695 [Thermofilaceae archaeon]
MRRRELALVLLVQILVAAALAGYLLYWRPKAAVVELKGAVGYITVVIDGRTVYNGEMHSLTVDGAILWSTILSRWATGGTGYHTTCASPTPYWMRVGYQAGEGSGYSDAAMSKSYGWNSTHMWLRFTGSFVAESAVTLKWVSLMLLDDRGDTRVVSNDTLPSIQVPQGSVYSIVITFYWKDYGALNVNFVKQFYVITPEALNVQQQVTARDGQTHDISGPRSDVCLTRNAWFAYIARHLQPRMFLIVSSRSNPPPVSRTEYDMPEAARYPVSYTLTDKGVVFSATIEVEATEVGLVAQVMTLEGATVEILLMRWVPPQPLQPGTTVRVYLVPP